MFRVKRSLTRPTSILVSFGSGRANLLLECCTRWQAAGMQPRSQPLIALMGYRMPRVRGTCAHHHLLKLMLWDLGRRRVAVLVQRVLCRRHVLHAHAAVEYQILCVRGAVVRAPTHRWRPLLCGGHAVRNADRLKRSEVHRRRSAEDWSVAMSGTPRAVNRRSCGEEGRRVAVAGKSAAVRATRRRRSCDKVVCREIAPRDTALLWRRC